MSTIVIRVNGVDITNDIVIADAEFTSQASGSPGTCKFRVKDMDMAYMFTVGHELTLDIDGRRMWGGYVLAVKRAFFFPVMDTETHRPCEPIERVPRGLIIEGVDYNILFRKRFCFDRDNPTNTELQSWPAGTHDDVIIRNLCQEFLWLDDDGLDTTTKVEYVGSANPDKTGNPAGAGHSWEQAMQAIASVTGAVFYIDPDKTLVYTDVDTPNASHGLSDTPGAGEIGYRDMEILHDGANLRNDALVWGAGQGKDHVVFSRTQDSASISLHNRWQVGDFRLDMYRQSSVDKRSSTFVYGSPQNKRGGKDDAVSVRCTVFEPFFRVAEKAVFTSDVFGFTDVIPIRRQRITFISPTEAQYDLYLSHHVDIPWNTSEFWMPDFTFRPPVIDIEIVLPPDDKYPYCPHENTFDAVMVFADRFDRRTSGQPPTSSGGQYYSGGALSPFTIGSDGKVPVNQNRTIVLDQYVSDPNIILLALDGAGSSRNLTITTGGSLSCVITGGSGLITHQAPFSYRTSAGSWTFGVAEVTGFASTSVMAGRFYLRVARGSGALWSGVKVWSQDEPEPPSWNAYMTGTPTNVIAGATNMAFDSRWSRAVTLQTGPKIEAIEVYGGVSTRYERGALFHTGSGGTLGQDDMNAWTLSMGDACVADPSEYVNPNLEPYMTLTESNSDSFPSYSMSVHRNQFTPRADSGYISNVTQFVPSVRLPPNDAAGGVAVNMVLSASVLGQFTVSVGAGKNNFDFSVPVEFAAFGHGDSPIGGQPYAYPYTMYGQTVLTLQDPGGVYEGPKLWTDFEATFGGGSLVDGRFQWGTRLQDPVFVKQAMDADSRWWGPFFTPNVETATVEVQNCSLWTKFNVLPRGQRFCWDGTQGGTTSTKICETLAIYGGIGGGPHTFTTLHSYQPGSLEITVDGLLWQSGRDFTELDPDGKEFMTLASLVDSRTLRVCYIPTSVLAYPGA